MTLLAEESSARLPNDSGTVPTQRADVIINPHETDHGQIQLLDIIPYDETVFERWNYNPYKAIHWGNGLSEGTGVHYLLPYWMARYHGLLAPPTE